MFPFVLIDRCKLYCTHYMHISTSDGVVVGVVIGSLRIDDFFHDDDAFSTPEFLSFSRDWRRQESTSRRLSCAKEKSSGVENGVENGRRRRRRRNSGKPHYACAKGCCARLSVVSWPATTANKCLEVVVRVSRLVVTFFCAILRLLIWVIFLVTFGNNLKSILAN